MKAIPIFALLFAGALAVIPEPEQEPTLVKSADCACEVCDCVDCECQPAELVSVVKPAEQTPAPDVPSRLVADLGYGHPQTMAPLVTEIALNRANKERVPALKQAIKATVKPILSAAEAVRARTLLNKNRIERIHQAPVVAQSQSVPSPSATVPPANLVRVYTGTVCNNGVCSPTYAWVPANQPRNYAGPNRRYLPVRGLLRRW